jgi:two-component system, NtrC family, sensor histidine kinase KinB
MTLRHRIIVALIPLFALLLALGGTATFLIYHVGDRIDRILRENYDSVRYMRDLNEALERIDSSFQFTLAGREKDSFKQYEDNWKSFNDCVTNEQNNITLPGEAELAEKLTALSRRYRQQGDKFFAGPSQDRDQLYFGRPDQSGLYGAFRDIKVVSGDILKINQDNMEKSNRNARRVARSALLWYGAGLGFGIVLAVLLIASTIRTILQPIRAVTESAAAIGAGNLDQLVPINSEDELGQLAQAFNNMARDLRNFQKSHKAQLIRAQRTSQATIDSFPDPVLVVDQQQHVELANPVARRLLVGMLPEMGEISPTVWQSPESLRQPLADALNNQREYVPEGYDKAVVVQIGEKTHTFLPRILPIRDPDGATLGAAVLLEDVTRFRLLDDMKTNLVATVSHELKTPLTSIRLVLHLLLEENLGALSPKQLELLVDARDNAERLLVMINNLLDLARLEQGKIQLNLRSERPASLLRSAADSFQPRAADQGVQLTLEASDNLQAVAVDADQFQHALQNLLDNALIHTPQGGRITLAAEPAGDKIVFSVADTGCGIPAQFMPYVFERYFRVPGDTAHGGSGLGLAIVREIITAHGGSVKCESIPGEKTVFIMSLPVWTATGEV